jgi:hypothetical protein
MKAHVNEEFFGGIFLPEIDLATFIEHNDLVENLDSLAVASNGGKKMPYIVYCLRGLVDGDDSS